MKLNDPTPKSEIKTRQGPGGRMLSYIDARFVMERLDAAVGSGNWQDRYEDTANGIRCGIGIRTSGDDWVWKWDAAEPSDIEPVKGAHSDAFKRAAVKWGIGRDLYGDHPEPAPRPVERPQTAPTPIRRSDAVVKPMDVPDEPDYLLDEARRMFADDVVPPDVQAGLDLIDESKCPDHHKEWRQNSKGYYCASKVGDGWCQRKPSKAWAASMELQPA